MAANGVGVPTQITLAGTGLVHIAGPEYQLSKSLSGGGTVVLTATVKDVAGNSASYSGAVTWTSSDTSVATVSSGTVTMVKEGEARIEASVPFGDSDGANSVLTGKVYAYVDFDVQA